jgi:allophanate hydrolase subunit 2
MVHAPTREQAISRLSHACSHDLALIGPTSNLEFASAIINSETFAKGETLTNFLDTRFSFSPCGIDVVNPGPYSTIQDYPARDSVGHGVPRSGPMDNLSSRIANLLVRNLEGTELIEATLAGPKLLFTSNAVVSVCGASAPVSIDGQERPMWASLVIEAGQTLQVGAIQDVGCHIYIAVRGGFPRVPQLLGSKSTSVDLKIGGAEGRTMREGDFLHTESMDLDVISRETHCSLPLMMIPDMKVEEIYVMQGPHDSEDIMTVADRNML